MEDDARVVRGEVVNGRQLLCRRRNPYGIYLTRREGSGEENDTSATQQHVLAFVAAAAAAAAAASKHKQAAAAAAVDARDVLQ